jgi:hypothetical protein
MSPYGRRRVHSKKARWVLKRRRKGGGLDRSNVRALEAAGIRANATLTFAKPELVSFERI